jgi:hypothetical protein
MHCAHHGRLGEPCLPNRSVALSVMADHVDRYQQEVGD